MKALVVSDTHNNISLFQKAVRYGVEEHGVEAIWHLGDNYEDGDKVDRLGAYLIRIPGIWHPGYRSGLLDTTYSLEFDDFSFFLVHDPADIKAFDKRDHAVFLHGHTHAPKVELQSGMLTINPGHLKKSFDRGYNASCAILETIENKLSIIHYDMVEKQIVRRASFTSVEGVIHS